jgi:transposase
MLNESPRIEIITGHERRRRYSAEHKLQLIEETMQSSMTVSEVARLHGVSPSLLFMWRQSTLKHDYARIRPTPDGATVLQWSRSG